MPENHPTKPASRLATKPIPTSPRLIAGFWARVDLLKARGLCVRCKQPNTRGGWHCGVCVLKQRGNTRTRRARIRQRKARTA